MNAHTSPLSDSLDQIRDSFSTISQLSSSVSLPPIGPTQATARTVKEVADLPERISDLIALGSPLPLSPRLLLARHVLDVLTWLRACVILVCVLVGRRKDAEYVFDRARGLLDAWVDGGVQGAREIREECGRLLEAEGRGEVPP